MKCNEKKIFLCKVPRLNWQAGQRVIQHLNGGVVYLFPTVLQL